MNVGYHYYSTPGETLQYDCLSFLNISPYQMAYDTGIPLEHIKAILRDERRIDFDMAHKLAYYFGTTPKSWVDLQKIHDQRKAWGNHNGRRWRWAEKVNQ